MSRARSRTSALPMPPSGKRRKSSCALRGGEEEVGLVALAVDRTVEPAAAIDELALHVVAGRQHIGAEVLGDCHQVDELHRLVAGDARHRRLALLIGVGEGLDHRVAEALLVVEDVVRDVQRGGDAAGIVDVLAGAAGALAMGRLAMVVELERDADDVIALAGEEAGNHRGIDATGHRDDDARVLGALGKIKRVHHVSHPVGFKGQRTGG